MMTMMTDINTMVDVAALLDKTLSIWLMVQRLKLSISSKET
jgi:hypothetical protein